MFAWCCPCSTSRRVGALDRHIHLLMLGLDNSGKTCTAKSLVGDIKNLSSVAPTVGFSRVETKYKGFQVTIFDLGGSKSFRGIWPKYFHEVHGFVFVVDAGDHNRIDECRESFREILRHDKVRGKPLLLLCNKSDVEDAQDEIQVVDELNVERLVNEARCPTRVERCVANKNQGLKVGFKWLVKSVIANMADLGPRVEADVELEKRLEDRRRAEVRKRIEERESGLQKQDEEDKEADNVQRGFVPMSELRKKWEEEKTAKPNGATVADNNGTTVEAAKSQQPKNGHQVQQLPPLISARAITPIKDPETVVPSPLPSEAAKPVSNGVNSAIKTNGSLPLQQKSLDLEMAPQQSLDLEPVAQRKKKGGLLKKLNRTAPCSVESKPGSSKSGSSTESLRVSQVIKAYTDTR